MITTTNFVKSQCKDEMKKDQNNIIEVKMIFSVVLFRENNKLFNAVTFYFVINFKITL